MKKNIIVEVVDITGEKGIPCAKNIFYLCLTCQKTIPSLPDKYVVCKCGNISVDIDGGRGGAKNSSKMIVLIVK